MVEAAPGFFEFYRGILGSVPRILVESAVSLEGAVAVAGAALAYLGARKLADRLLQHELSGRWVAAALCTLVAWSLLDANHARFVALHRQLATARDEAARTASRELDRRLVAERRIQSLQERLETFRFSVPLFAALPGDVDLVVRGFPVDIDDGGKATIFEPTGGRLWLRLSGMQRIGGGWGARLWISNRDRQTQSSTEGSAFISLEEGTITGPISLSTQELYVSVDSRDFDAEGRGTVRLSIAKRRVPELAKSRGIVAPPGSIKLGDLTRPSPIVLNAPVGVTPAVPELDPRAGGPPHQ